MSEHLYVVIYDIRHPKRWRRIFRTMHGFGEWLQLSAFQCRLSARRREQMLGRLESMIDAGEDHVLCLDLGPAESIKPQVTSLGLPFRPVDAGPRIL